MVIYLRHFVYGTKVATLEAEALADEKNGWVRYDPESSTENEQKENQLELKRRGRPLKTVDREAS